MSNNRIIITIIAIILLIGGTILLYPRNNTPVEDTRIRITASFYPLAYFAETIGGEQVKVSTLIPYNNEVHSWQPSIRDIAGAEESDIIVYLGAGLDHWVEDDILTSIKTEGKTIVEASKGIELIAASGAEADEHGDGDPHLWVSPYTGRLIAENIYNALVSVDPDHADYYSENWRFLEAELERMDQEYQTGLAPVEGKTFFTTHSAYGYVANRYGLHQFGVIGFSADEQPSTAKIAEIVDAMINADCYVVYVDPIYSEAYAQTLKTELTTQTGHDIQILQLYLMLGPIDNQDYLEQLESNLNNLKAGLVK